MALALRFDAAKELDRMNVEVTLPETASPPPFFKVRAYAPSGPCAGQAWLCMGVGVALAIFGARMPFMDSRTAAMLSKGFIFPGVFVLSGATTLALGLLSTNGSVDVSVGAD